MPTTTFTTKLASLFDEYILLLLTVFLIVFIPLYPKIPLFDIIPGYIVRVRLEDIFILLSLGVFCFQLLRKKVNLATPASKYIGLYILIGALSTISGILITQTIPPYTLHVAKSTLHFLRYIQYFSLLFLTTASITTQKHLRVVLGAFIATLIAVAFYGAGQKYLYWPVYSTMNREFSKGIVLYLTEHARVQSTFAGHYDMAAYLVLVVPLMLLVSSVLHSKFARLAAHSAFVLGTWLITVSASRTSYAGFLVAIAVAILLVSIQEKTIKNKLYKFAMGTTWSGLVIVCMLIFFGEGISGRVKQSLEAYPKYFALYSRYQQAASDFSDSIATATGTDQFQAEKPENGLSVDQAAVVIASDTRPTPIKPSDVFVEVPDKVTVATISAEGVPTTVVLEVPRNYSDNALKHGLSLAIRLDTLWPQALQGFYTNPLLGTGYATLTKGSVEQFTEADSTDNNFLRTLGETGLLGFVTFYGAIVITIWSAVQTARKTTKSAPLVNRFALAFIAGSSGLLINALFIDVFAASKVAFTYWTLAGVISALPALSHAKAKKIRQPEQTFLHKKIRKAR